MTSSSGFGEGLGAGSLSYSIGGQPARQADCAFKAVQSETGSLRLEIDFTDTRFGGIALAVVVSNYSPAQYRYPASTFSVAVNSQTPAVGSGSLVLKNLSATTGAVYAGSLNQPNLSWQGTNQQPALGLRLNWFFLTLTPGASGALAVSDSGGDGWSTVTCQVGTNTPQTAFGSAGVYITPPSPLDENAVLSIASSWTDPTYGALYVLATFNYVGTGIYDSTQIFIQTVVDATNGEWSNYNLGGSPGIIVNVISTAISWGTLLQASMSIMQLPWVHEATVPDEPGLDLSMSVFANVLTS